MPTPRYLPDEPLPPYTFVPGQKPHPVSDPAGHSFGVTHAPPAPLAPERWRECHDYLRGLDLFNNGYYWEAHEAWEGLWHAAGRKGAVADFLKGLIKLAAAGVKQLEGEPKGVKSHARRAADLWPRAGESVFLGLPVGALVELAERVAEVGWPEAPPLLRPA